MVNWTSNWPDDDGYYWLAASFWERETRVYLVKIRWANSNMIIFVENQILSEGELERGYKWAKAVLPSLPEAM